MINLGSLLLACAAAGGLFVGMLAIPPSSPSAPDDESVVAEPARARSYDAVVELNERTLMVEVVATPEARAQGLSGRRDLPQGTGMWFVFARPDRYAFWMPDMYLSLDIIWFDEQYRIVHIEPDVTPESYPKSFRPPTPAQYVLEIPAGTAAREGFALGQQAVMSSTE